MNLTAPAVGGKVELGHVAGRHTGFLGGVGLTGEPAPVRLGAGEDVVILGHQIGVNTAMSALAHGLVHDPGEGA